KDCLPDPNSIGLDALDAREREERSKVEAERDKLFSRFTETGKSLVRAMAQAKAIDTGALTQFGTEIQDIQHYLDRLRMLNEEALPDKLDRFLKYLNLSSDQGVTQLLVDIDNEVSIIEERINDLNETLRRVDFQPDRYLQLMPQKLVHESLR